MAEYSSCVPWKGHAGKKGTIDLCARRRRHTSFGSAPLKLHQKPEWTERETIRRALETSGGIKKDAAELMGISQRALSYYLAKYRID